MNLQKIKNVITSQKNNWKNVSVDDFTSRQSCRESIENDFLSENDITDRSDEFDDDVDYDEVCNIRADAMIDVLEALSVTQANDYEELIEGLNFSHVCGGCTFNNVNIEAYHVDSHNYKLIRFVTKANGDHVGNIDSLNISKENYNNLNCDDYNQLIRFHAVNDLFYDK